MSVKKGRVPNAGVDVCDVGVVVERDGLGTRETGRRGAGCDRGIKSPTWPVKGSVLGIVIGLGNALDRLKERN